MTFFWQMLQLQLQILMLLGVGFLVRKLNIVTSEVRKGLSALLINVILPCNIVNSFIGGIEVTKDLLWNCVLAVIISLVIQIVATYGSKVIFRQYSQSDVNVMSYGMIVSNSSFIGIPIIESIYGGIAVMFTSVFQIPIRVTMWTAGLALFKTVEHKDVFKTILKHPCVVAVELGSVLMMLQISFPVFVTGTIGTISRCTTTVSMLVVGSILAEIEWNNLFDGKVLYYCFWRLIGYPLVVFLVLRLLRVPDLITIISVIMTGMPAGSTTAILAEQYGCDAQYAAKIILVSTLLSALTIPVLCLVL